MHVAEIWRYPVKSLKGERITEAEITPLGIPHDRQIVVIRAINNRMLTSRTRPKLLGLQGSLDADGTPTINGHRWDSAEALELVKQAAGEEVTLEMSTPNRAGLLLPQGGDENEDVLMLVMPVMLNTYA